MSAVRELARHWLGLRWFWWSSYVLGLDYNLIRAGYPALELLERTISMAVGTAVTIGLPWLVVHLRIETETRGEQVKR